MKQYLSNAKSRTKLSRISIGLMVLMVLVGVAPNYVFADQFQEQIDALNAQNDQKKVAQDQLGAQAVSLNDSISKIEAEISSIQKKINDNQSQVESLKKQIKEAEDELLKQKKVLGETIKTIYVEGDISTVEMLATSKDLSDFFDKQQYRESVRSKIKTTMDKITTLKLELNGQREKVEKYIAEQKTLQSQLAQEKADKDQKLALNQNEQSALDSQIKDNNEKVKELRRQQAIENAKHFTGTRVVAGSNGRDTYPNLWRNSGQDTLLDSWGMYNRECVSYTAWKVYESGRFMPYWGGRGNANQWDDNARSAGISVDYTPRAGDVAIAHWGYYGHAMYVESVNGNGTINISQYNWDFNGTYSEVYNFPASGLVFIHF